MSTANLERARALNEGLEWAARFADRALQMELEREFIALWDRLTDEEKRSAMSKLDESRTKHTRDDYETPPCVLARVRKALGGRIGLDPFANERNSTHAESYLTRGALTEIWSMMPSGVFCNPPYGQALLPFAEKVVDEALSGCEIITLTPARPDTKWWRTLQAAARFHAVIRGRLTFELDGEPVLGKNGKPQPCQFPCAFTYFGPNPTEAKQILCADRFADAYLLL